MYGPRPLFNPTETAMDFKRISDRGKPSRLPPVAVCVILPYHAIVFSMAAVTS